MQYQYLYNEFLKNAHAKILKSLKHSMLVLKTQLHNKYV